MDGGIDEGGLEESNKGGHGAQCMSLYRNCAGFLTPFCNPCCLTVSCLLDL